MAKGIVRVPSATTEKIVAVIASLGREAFRIADVRSRIPSANKQSVRDIIARKARAGWLERCGHGTYRLGGVRIKTALPAGLVVEAVWAVLSTDHEHRFKRMPEVAGEAETYIGRPGVDLRKHTSTILSRWHRSGHLERTGEKGEYAYRLRSGITERPIMRH